ncbi:hypothetical protein BN2476_940046 [Paraburkholderia piptadeniae]|uniref:Uncharacterized protein n=1 Tax=Paraburkholderia piptadeniae TaxID=1701573 RepID=A0A1N7STJ4_9BURK|nr:hypothetical protein BN2476_940046 [Paraburkholderia piptadeniae]
MTTLGRRSACARAGSSRRDPRRAGTLPTRPAWVPVCLDPGTRRVRRPRDYPTSGLQEER